MSLTMVGRRVAAGVLVIFMVSLVAFSLIHLLPGDAAQAIAGERATAEDVARIQHELGLDQPLLEQYVDWSTAALRGDLGDSLSTHQPVTERLVAAAPVTFSLTAVAIVIALVLGVGLGLVAAWNSGGWVDRVVSTTASLGIALPSFWTAMLLVLLFSQQLGWLPATRYEPLSQGVGAWLRHVIIPSAALALPVAAEFARHTRGAVDDVLNQPYIRSARARGASGAKLLTRHVVRNAAIPVVTLLGLQVGRLLGGSIIVESVVGMAGLGTVAVTAILQRDYPVIQGYVLVAATVVVVANLAVDLMYGWINPRTAG